MLLERCALGAALLLMGVGSWSVVAQQVRVASPPDARAAGIAFVQSYCVSCHGSKVQKGQMRLDKLVGKPGEDRDEAAVWKSILDQLESGAMPPKESPQPRRETVEAMRKWLHEELRAVASGHEHLLPSKGNLVDHDLLFHAPSRAAPSTPARVWRLSTYNYFPFLDSLTSGPLMKETGPTGGGKEQVRAVVMPFGLTTDPGFRDYAHLYRVSGSETQQLAANARIVLEGMLKKQPRRQPPAALAGIAESSVPPSAAAVQAAVHYLFGAVLYREPTAEELKRYSASVLAGVQRFGNREGLIHGLAPVLLHPEAIFRSELGQGQPDEHGRRLLGPNELAVAIAYALTDSRPDATLLAAARDGKLATKEDVRREVLRLLADEQTDKPRILRFFQEYFDYYRAPLVFKDEQLVREAGLARDASHYQVATLVRDTDLLVEHILAKDRDVLREMLTTNLSYIGSNKLPDVIARLGKVPNSVKPSDTSAKAKKPSMIRDGINPFDDKSPLYKHYNFDVSKWSVRQPLTLPENQRLGILTQPSWLIAHSANTENHAIARGKWIRERLLGGFIPDTPITVEAKLPEEPERTLRERMRVTRETYCYKCHVLMDPLGLPFEIYDHFGRYRTTELGKPVDATGEIVNSGDPKLDGKVNNALEMIRKLADSERVHQVFVRHAFRYWMGRNETLDDAPTLQAAYRSYRDSNGSMKALIVALLTSDSFLYRK